jgi:hypothetical protein
MTQNILSSLLSKASFSLVIRDTGLVTCSSLKVSRVGIKLDSIAQRHKQESGTTFVDSRVLRAIVVSVDCFCPDIDTLSQVNEVLNDRSQLYTITSKGLIIDYMRLDKEEIHQTPEVLSASPLRLMFKQVLAQYQTQTIYAQSGDVPIISRGLAILSTAEQGVTGLASTVASNVSGFLGTL